MKNNNWTPNDIPDQSGKVVIITGANSGLGFETTKMMAARGAKIVMACRSIKKGEEARDEILATNPDAKLQLMELDLMSLDSIRFFAKNFNNSFEKLDILINNAGIMMPPYQLTKDGFESQFGTNHLGHFALTGLLLDKITKTNGARVVNVSSIAHKRGDMDFANLMYENGKDYSPTKAYGRSKLANLLFTYELQRFFEEKKIDAISVAAHPGVAKTNLAKFMMKKWLMNVLFVLLGWMFQPADKGALPQVMAATKPNIKGGSYFGPTGFNEMSGKPGQVKSTSLSHDIELARQLWKVSEKLTGVKFN